MATKKNKGANKALAITINLLPGEYRKQQKDLTWLTDRRVVWPTVFFILAIFVALFTYAYTLQELSSKDAELQSVRAAVERERPLLKKISELEKNQSIINTKINALKSIQISKKRWVVLFENISSVLPPNMWLLSVSQVSFTLKVELKKDLGEEG